MRDVNCKDESLSTGPKSLSKSTEQNRILSFQAVPVCLFASVDNTLILNLGLRNQEGPKLRCFGTKTAALVTAAPGH